MSLSQPHPPFAKKRRICYLILPHVHVLDLAGTLQVFYEASTAMPHAYELHYTGIRQRETTEQGLAFGELELFNEVELTKDDFIVVPGISFDAFVKGRLSDDIAKIKGWLRKHAAQGTSIASVCSGALILAAAGILDGKKCTSHWKCIDYLKTTYPKAKVQIDQLFVRDANVYTSAGMTSGIDLALSILEQDHGPILTAKVAREIVVYMRRNSKDRQQTIYLDYKTHFNPAVHKVQDYIISHPGKDPGIEELAGLFNVSKRNLTRMFHHATGHTITEFKTAVKIELARSFIHNADFTLEKIAHAHWFPKRTSLEKILAETTRPSPEQVPGSHVNRVVRFHARLWMPLT